MQKLKNSVCILSMLLSILTGALQAAFCAQSSIPNVNPEVLYHQTWRLVRDNYYDNTFNGKDWTTWEHKFDGKLSTREQALDAINQMLAQLDDPYTRFLDCDDTRKERSLMTDSQMVGIGILLQQDKDNKHLLVADTLDDSPAARAGVTGGDELLAVDGNSVTSLTPDQCGQRIVGKENTQVSLLLSKGDHKRTVSMKREHMVLHPVTVKNLEGNVGYIRLSSFLYGDAVDEFRKGLSSMADKDGLILDLRHNPGGQMFNALSIADMLMDGGIIVRTVDRKGRAVDCAQGHPLTKQPMVVLVDHDSASASEILAAALQDHNRAEIVGTKTYGKGLVQDIMPLPGGAALHITVAQFMSPNGAKINHVGVTPELEVADPGAQLKAGLDLLRAKIAKANQSNPDADRKPVSLRS